MIKKIITIGLLIGAINTSIASIEISKDFIKFPDGSNQVKAMPDPTGNNNKALTSNGTSAEWKAVGGVPSGTIVMWSGSNVPSGWAICNGSNGTPNLTGKFIKAATTAGSTGGSNTHTHGHTLQGGAHTLTVAQMPSHAHTNNVHSYGWPDGSADRRSTGRYWVEQNAYNYRRSTNETGGSSSHSHPVSGSINSGSNQPEYYSLLFIMKL